MSVAANDPGVGGELAVEAESIAQTASRHQALACADVESLVDIVAAMAIVGDPDVGHDSPTLRQQANKVPVMGIGDLTTAESLAERLPIRCPTLRP